MYTFFGVFVVSCGIGVPVPILLCANCMTEQTRQQIFSKVEIAFSLLQLVNNL